MTPDATDRRLLVATQGGLPLVAAPYAEVARWLGLGEAEVIARMQRMQAEGIIRRVAAVPDFAALGQGRNAMSVWDVSDGEAPALAREIGALAFVTHCHLRPRQLPGWPYNLFAMIHGPDRAGIAARRDEIAARLGAAARASALLHTAQAFKRSGLRLKPPARPAPGLAPHRPPA